MGFRSLVVQGFGGLAFRAQGQGILGLWPLGAWGFQGLEALGFRV